MNAPQTSTHFLRIRQYFLKLETHIISAFLTFLAFQEHLNDDTQTTLGFNVDEVVHNLTVYRNAITNDTIRQKLISEIKNVATFAKETETQAVSFQSHPALKLCIASFSANLLSPESFWVQEKTNLYACCIIIHCASLLSGVVCLVFLSNHF